MATRKTAPKVEASKAPAAPKANAEVSKLTKRVADLEKQVADLTAQCQSTSGGTDEQLREALSTLRQHFNGLCKILHEAPSHAVVSKHIARLLR